MSNKLKTASSLSADSTEVRYQKALKEITKLIGVNTELREEIAKYQDQLNELQYKMEENAEQVQKLLEDKANLEDELKAALTQNKALVKDNQQLKKQIGKSKRIKLPDDSKTRKKQTVEPSLTENEKSVDAPHNIFELERMLDRQKQTIKQLTRKLQAYESNGIDHGFKHIYSDNIRSSINNNELNKKLSVANDYIEKVNEQNINLKSRLIKAQSSNKLLSVRSMDVLSKYSPQMSPRVYNYNGESRNSEQVLRRYRHLEDENKKLTKKLEQTKFDNEQVREHNNKLKKENANFALQITGYQALITKQQDIIGELHSNYEKDVTKMTEDFKQKLIDQRQNFSPAKSADHLKTIEALQMEIKGLKKKLQLYQIQLTKYIRTMQAYKSKLSECEKDVNQLMSQREQLIEKLSKLQSSNRERSNHSRGSTSRIMVENERRNSMGDTGYFNYS